MNYGLFVIVFGCGLTLTYFVALLAGPELLIPTAICYLAAIHISMGRGTDTEKNSGGEVQTESYEEESSSI